MRGSQLRAKDTTQLQNKQHSAEAAAASQMSTAAPGLTTAGKHTLLLPHSEGPQAHLAWRAHSACALLKDQPSAWHRGLAVHCTCCRRDATQSCSGGRGRGKAAVEQCQRHCSSQCWAACRRQACRQTRAPHVMHIMQCKLVQHTPHRMHHISRAYLRLPQGQVQSPGLTCTFGCLCMGPPPKP